jgi:AcrR family transcriptional regulator
MKQLSNLEDSSKGKAPSALKARKDRLAIVSDAKKSHILAAAKEVFEEYGLEGASVREIAKRAGYTPGAIYSYFTAKEEIYGALLADSLERLNNTVSKSSSGAKSSTQRAERSALGFYQFYASNPRDLDLGFYLFGGARPYGLTPELNKTLNTRLRDSLQHFEHALLELGASPKVAKEEVTAFFAHCVGLLILENTHRIRMFKEDSAKLCSTYVTQVLDRVKGRKKGKN